MRAQPTTVYVSASRASTDIEVEIGELPDGGLNFRVPNVSRQAACEFQVPVAELRAALEHLGDTSANGRSEPVVVPAKELERH